MRDYSSWKEKFVPVTTLLLDPQNPRIPPARSGAARDQRDLIAELVEHDHVYDLARDIADVGYYPLESLIGLQEGSKQFVLEGNRRLAALKLLISPDLAPNGSAKKFRNLSVRIHLDSIKKVRVLFAPTREAAAPLIMQKHTRQQIERWSPLMQARFYKTLVVAGMALDDVERQYGTTAGEVAHFLRTDAMYEVARAMDLAPEVRAVVENPREFQVSVLQRLIDVPVFRDFLGIDFDERGNLRGKVDVRDFRRAFARILTDIVTGVIDTRKLNKVEDVETYIKKDLAGLAPEKKKKSKFTKEDVVGTAPTTTQTEDSAPSSSGGGRPARTARESPSIIPAKVRCRVDSARIRDIFNELRHLSVAKHPNSSAVLFRILLELAMGNYLERTKKLDAYLATQRGKGKPADWFPSLRQLLTVFLEAPDVALPPLARKRLNRLKDADESPLKIDDLDAFVHNKYMTPTERELRSFWIMFEEVFAIILEEPAPPPPAGA